MREASRGDFGSAKFGRGGRAGADSSEIRKSVWPPPWLPSTPGRTYWFNNEENEMIRKSMTEWKGDGLTGSGSLGTESGALRAQPFSFKTRFQDGEGKAGTNPEEL